MKEAGDKSGLIYGMGHAIYSVSDPRALTFHSFVEQLAIEKGMEKEQARIASTLKSMGMSKEDIVKATGLPLEVVESLC